MMEVTRTQQWPKVTCYHVQRDHNYMWQDEVSTALLEESDNPLLSTTIMASDIRDNKFDIKGNHKTIKVKKVRIQNRKKPRVRRRTFANYKPLKSLALAYRINKEETYELVHTLVKARDKRALEVLVLCTDLQSKEGIM